MHLIICDDDRTQVEIIRTCLAHRPGCDVTAFDSAEQLLSHPPDRCDMAILDLTPDSALPARLTHMLRERFPAVDLVFLSAFPRCATVAFRLEASQFLLKPVEKTVFLREFDFLVARRGERKFRWVVSNKTAVYALFPSEIVYIEAYHRHLFIHTQGQVIDICGKLSQACEVLMPYGFGLCHQGFLVNLRYVKSVGQNQLFCAGGELLPVSERKRKEFLRRYTQFLVE